ncbi:TonB-dependent receptor [Cupriavidus basilensis]|uniref:TonB-dependent receptor n=1 Tax=Cupriavidus basilensis TaxID=68895 RepID=UPI001D5A9029|nr:TonB-dependent receptor [Cupriavidus basilensis]
MKHRYHCWALLGPVAVAGNALAEPIANQPNGNPSSTSGDSTFTLGSVTVQASQTGKLSTRNVLTSVDVLGADRIEDQNVNSAWELFGQMPGVLLTDFNQGTTSGKFSFRAFNGEGEINAVKLLIDGIPSNTNDGNMPFIDAIFPLEISSIETVRGTNDARYGLNNIAGNASINTLLGGNYARGRVGYGSFNTLDTEAAAGIDNGNLSQNYFFGYRKSQGYRDHSDTDKVAVSGKWFYTPDDGRFRVGMMARYYAGNAQEPGYLTQADAHANRSMSYAFNQTDEGKREMGQYSLHADAELTPQLSWSNKAYVNTFRDRRWVTYSAGVSQQERFADEQQVGASSVMTYRPKVSWLRDFAVEGGVDMERQSNQSLRYNTVNQIRVKQTRDQDFDFDVYGAYLQTIIKPIDSLKLIPAYRVDIIRGNFTNGLTGQQYAINDYGTIGQPKISAVYTLVDGYSLYGNWGRTFQAGVGAGAYKIPPRTTDLAPSINDGWELGLKFSPRSWLEGRIAYWEQLASHEVRRKLNDPLGDSDNLGKTKRHGIDLQANLRPHSQFNVWFAYSYQMAKIVDPGPADAATAGNQIDHVPNHLVSGGIDYQATPALRLSMWGNAQSSYYLEKTNSTGKFGAYALLNLGLGYKITKSLMAEVQVKNVTNRYYEYVWNDGTQNLHSPGPGRSVFASVTLSY